MKLFLLLAFTLTAALPLARAETITLSDRDINDERASMPVELIATLNPALKFREMNEGVHAISAKDIHCELRMNGALDTLDPKMGVPETTCRVNSENARDSRKGKLLPNSAKLWEQLTALNLTDCAMGYCAGFVKSLNCTVDTRVDTLRGAGRFACTLDFEY